MVFFLLLFGAGIGTSFVKITATILICILGVLTSCFLPKVVGVLSAKTCIMFVEFLLVFEIAMVVLGV
jgi:hypothetical protein